MRDVTCRRSVVGVFIALVVSACGEEARVSYTFFEAQGSAQEPPFLIDPLVIEFSDGSIDRRLTPADFDAGSSRRDTPEFSTRTSGGLLTRFWLIGNADTLASGELQLDLRPDFRWNVSFLRASSDPTTTCFGCAGSLAVPLDATLQRGPADSLWLVWGGNSIRSPVIF